MQRKFMAQFLLGAVIFTGAFALKAEAGSNQPSPSNPSQQPAFSCDTSSGIPKTVSNRTNRTLFEWNNYRNPHQQCASVTNRLNNLVRRNGGSTQGLFLKAGLVNNQTVVCVGTVAQFGCNSGNTVVNITQGNQSTITNAGDVVEPLQDQISDLISGEAAIQSGGKKGVSLGNF
ncbi:COP23 domain-containing protein [Kamptonema formosum]|uniref:COP23 domain-containing protein n=1 Tax=Kamptonema formosum TaxID=331992 RepID=UPI001E600217|nr:COP23 domain-containing protein [Oscillatoria sp. PCC 10802]